MVDTLSLTEYAQMPTNRHQGTFSLAANPSTEAGLGATADRAVATARLLLRLIGTLKSGHFNYDLEQEEHTQHFL